MLSCKLKQMKSYMFQVVSLIGSMLRLGILAFISKSLVLPPCSAPKVHDKIE